MNEKDLFKAVRQEDVVIFAGAGFSKYAGFPTGTGLTEIFYNKLSADEQLKINIHAPLDYLTEEIIRIRHGSRDLINEVLDEVFTMSPVSIAGHELLASIPQFKTIVTTNYDTLFEQAYAGDATLIYKEADVVNWKENQVNILKIHGDIADKSSIILTRDDYSRFYQKDYSSPFWATIIKAIATKTILFLGYGYEDPNVWALFKHVYSYIGDNKKAVYFVGPNADADKIHFLSTNGIHYINYDGETFLKALFENIQDNIFRDIENNIVNPEIARKFIQRHNLSLTLKSKEDGYKIHSIQASDGGEMHGNMKFTLDAGSDFPERYKEFFEKGQFLELVLGQSDLTNFRMDVEGLTLYGDGELTQISIRKTPREFAFDLVFSSEGLEIRNLIAQVFAGKKSINVKTKIHTLNFDLTIDLTNPEDIQARYKMEHDPIYRNINEEIEVNQFLKYFFSQKEVSIYLNKNSKITKICPVFSETNIAQADNYLLYFNALKEVEKAFNIRFADFYDINEESSEDLNWTLKVIRGEKFILGDTIEFTFGELSPEVIENLPKLKGSELPMELYINSDRVMLLHGQRLPVPGQRIQVPFPEVINIDELKNGDSKKMKIKSRSGEIYEYFKITPFSEAIKNPD